MFFIMKNRIGVNLLVALMLGTLFINSGNEGSRVLDNYNLLFAILLHHSMTTMMLTVLTCEYFFSILHDSISTDYDMYVNIVQFQLRWAFC